MLGRTRGYLVKGSFVDDTRPLLHTFDTKGYSNQQVAHRRSSRPVVNGSFMNEGRRPDLASRMSASHDRRRRPTLPMSSLSNLIINGLIRDVRRRPDLTLRMPEQT